jgi:hypothetical protein
MIVEPLLLRQVDVTHLTTRESPHFTNQINLVIYCKSAEGLKVLVSFPKGCMLRKVPPPHREREGAKEGKFEGKKEKRSKIKGKFKLNG